jgi:hypothetical protein
MVIAERSLPQTREVRSRLMRSGLYAGCMPRQRIDVPASGFTQRHCAFRKERGFAQLTHETGRWFDGAPSKEHR